MKRSLPYLIVLTVALFTTGAGVALYQKNKAPALQASVDSDGQGAGAAHVRGAANAPVTIEEFGDYQCPPCGKLSEPLNQVERDFAGKVRIIFRQFPLEVHPHAALAAYAAEAAGLQKRFWEMHDLLYQEQEAWSKAAAPEGMFVGYAKTLGLDAAKFRQDMQSKEVKERVATDQKRAAKVGVSVTPTVFVNGRSLNGPALGRDGIHKAVTEALAEIPAQP
ncbi:MAG: thioredoxin domain-containing protein [Chthoniobacterales bacterium]